MRTKPAFSNKRQVLQFMSDLKWRSSYEIADAIMGRKSIPPEWFAIAGIVESLTFVSVRDRGYSKNVIRHNTLFDAKHDGKHWLFKLRSLQPNARKHTKQDYYVE